MTWTSLSRRLATRKRTIRVTSSFLDQLFFATASNGPLDPCRFENHYRSPNVFQQQLTRSLAWAPPAYTIQKEGGRTRTRKNSRKKSKRSLNKTGHHGSTSSRSSGSKKQRQRRTKSGKQKPTKQQQQEVKPSQYGTNFFNEGKLGMLQDDLLELLTSYKALVDEYNPQEESIEKSPVVDGSHDLWNQTKLILSLLDDLEKSMTRVQGKAHFLEATYQVHVESYRLTDKIIRIWTQQPPNLLRDQTIVDSNDLEDNMNDMETTVPFSHDVAEQLLRLFMKLLDVRNQVVQNTTPKQQDTTRAQLDPISSWTDWFRNAFGLFQEPLSQRQDNDHHVDGQEEQPKRLLPVKVRKNTFRSVVRAIVRGSEQVIWNDKDEVPLDTDAVDQDHFAWKRHFRNNRDVNAAIQQEQGDLAKRLNRLVDVTVKHNEKETVVCSQVRNLLVDANTKVGLVYLVAQAERLSNKYATVYSSVERPKTSASKFKGKMLHSLLKGYRLAASLETTQDRRANAAKCAEWLVRKRQEILNSKVKEQPYTSYYDTVVCYKLALQALANPGVNSLGDMVERAEGLMEVLMGKEQFRQLLEGHYSKPSEETILPDAGILHYLMVIYMLNNENEKIKHVLECMETNYSKQPECNNDIQGEHVAVTKKKGAVSFPGIWTYHTALAGFLRNRTGDFSRREADAVYGTSLLDSMGQTLGSPDFDSFRLAMILWTKSKSPQAGDQALALLSRMHVASAASGYSWVVDSSCYDVAFECLIHAAAGGQPGAAQRAMRLLNMMHAQCAPYSQQASNGDRENSSYFYNEELRPRLKDYNLVIECCSNTVYPSDQRVALDIAFDAFNLMVERGVYPWNKTYAKLLACCSNLLKDDPERRKELSRLVLESAVGQNKVTKNVLSALVIADEELYNEYIQTGQVPVSSSGVQLHDVDQSSESRGEDEDEEVVIAAQDTDADEKSVSDGEEKSGDAMHGSGEDQRRINDGEEEHEDDIGFAEQDTDEDQSSSVSGRQKETDDELQHDTSSEPWLNNMVYSSTSHGSETDSSRSNQS